MACIYLVGVLLLYLWNSAGAESYHPYGYDGIMFGQRFLSDKEIPLNVVIYRASVPHHVKEFSWFFRQTSPSLGCLKRPFKVFVQFNKLPIHRVYNKPATDTIYSNISEDNVYELEGFVGGGAGKTAWLNVPNPRPGEWFAVVNTPPRRPIHRRILIKGLKDDGNKGPYQCVTWMMSDIRWQFYHEFFTLPIAKPTNFIFSLKEKPKLLRFSVYPEMVRVRVRLKDCTKMLPEDPSMQTTATLSSTTTVPGNSTLSPNVSIEDNNETDTENSSLLFNSTKVENATQAPPPEDYSCPLLFRVRGKAFPIETSPNYTCDRSFTNNETCYFDFVPRDTGEYYLTVIKTNPNVTLNFTLEIETTECKEGQVELSRFENFAESVSTVECVPVYHIQRHGNAGYGAYFSFLRKEYGREFSVMSSGHVIVNKNRDLLHVKNTPIAYQFVVDPYEDVSGNLIINLRGFPFPKTDIGQLVEVCVYTNRAPVTIDGKIPCKGKLYTLLNVTSHHPATVKWIIPHPESGDWFITVWRTCYRMKSGLPLESKCPRDFSGLKAEMSIVQCLNKCSGNGACKFNSDGGVMYGYCECNKGWQGPDCSDFDIKDIKDEFPILQMMLLTLSNAGFMPAIVLAFSRKHLAEGLVYAFTMVASAMYHACDSFHAYEPDVCVLNYDILSIADFYSSLYSFWVTLLAIACLTEPMKSLGYASGALFLVVAIHIDRTSVWIFAGPVVTGVIIISISWIRKCRTSGRCYPSGKKHIGCIVIGGILAASALCIFSFAETDVNYAFTHSAWHVLISGSLLFLLPPKERTDSDVSDRVTQEEPGAVKQPFHVRFRKSWTSLKKRASVRKRKDSSQRNGDDLDCLTEDQGEIVPSTSQNYELLQAVEL